MWLTEGCGGRRRAVATPNRESRKEKKNILDFERLVIYTTTLNQPYFQFLKHGFEHGLSKVMINSLFEIYVSQKGLISIEQISNMTF